MYQGLLLAARSPAPTIGMLESQGLETITATLTIRDWATLGGSSGPLLVPEPHSAALLGLGLIALAWRRRRA